jgi:uncharacterized MAPEG superfamily protein
MAVSIPSGAALWFAVWHYAPVPAGMEALSARMIFTLKCCAMAVLLCLSMGIDAVAHERLQSPAFDPLAGYATRRLQVNQRYLQNTLEQFVLFAVGLFGLAAYAADGDAMRAVTASTVTWIVGRLAFWIGYHRSATMRVLGAPSLLVGQVMLFYVAMRIGGEIAGDIGTWAMLAGLLGFEAVLFWFTRERRAT